MEEVVLNHYIKWRRKKTDMKSALKEIGYKKLIWLYVMVLSTLLSSICLFLFKTNPVTYLFLLSELFCAMVLYGNKRSGDLDTTVTDMKKLDRRYSEVRVWASDLGFARKNQVKQLCRRCEKLLLEDRTKKESLIKMVDRVFLVFLFPVLASFMLWLMDVDTMAAKNLGASVQIGLFGIGVYVLIRSVIAYLWPAYHRKNEIMRMMVRDLQGMLDRRYPVENTDLI